MKLNTLIHAILSGIVGCSAANAAITVNTHTFSAVTNGAVDTSGTADWGFVSVAGGFFGGVPSYNNTDFGSVANGSGGNITTVSGSSSIGSVTLTEGAGATAGTDTVSPQNNISNYTFNATIAHGSYGNFAPTEQDVWQMTFNDLGVGEFQIILYMGHSTLNRSFDMDVTGTGITPFTTTTGAISGLGSTVAAYGTTGAAFTYDINVTTTGATDDLTLTFGGTGGGSGGAILAGYTVTAVPEPSTSVLFGLAGMVFFVRRRR